MEAQRVWSGDGLWGCATHGDTEPRCAAPAQPHCAQGWGCLKQWGELGAQAAGGAFGGWGAPALHHHTVPHSCVLIAAYESACSTGSGGARG